MTQQLTQAQVRFAEIRREEKENKLLEKRFQNMVMEFVPRFSSEVIGILKKERMTISKAEFIAKALYEKGCVAADEKYAKLNQNFSPSTVAEVEKFIFVWSLQRLTEACLLVQRTR